MQKPVFINANPLKIMQKLYEIKARQDGSKLKVIVTDVTEEYRAQGKLSKLERQKEDCLQIRGVIAGINKKC